MLLPSGLRNRLDVYMVKLNHRFDQERIVKEVLPAIPEHLVTPHRQDRMDDKVNFRDGSTQYHTGGWLGLPLIPPKEKCLSDFPYVKHMVEWFKAPAVRCRFLMLEAGHKINPHCGNMDEVEKVRLLIPLQITDETVYKCGPYEYRLQAGEIWYLNQTQTHSVENNGSTRRTVLVLDLLMNDHVKGLFAEIGVTV